MGLISRVSSRTYRSKMRTQLCQFSAMKIYPGHGKDFIRYDGKRIVLINGKSERLFRKKKNPRKITWTVLYRRKHKKGTMTELDARKRNKRAVKVNRGIGGQSWAEIQAKKNQKPERPPLPNKPSKRTSNNKNNVSVARGKKISFSVSFRSTWFCYNTNFVQNMFQF